jgi:hypothetical protein
MHFLRRLTGRGETEQGGPAQPRREALSVGEQVSPPPGLSLQEEPLERRSTAPMAEDVERAQERRSGEEEVLEEGGIPDVATDPKEGVCEEEASSCLESQDRGRREKQACEQQLAERVKKASEDVQACQEGEPSSSSDVLSACDAGFERQAPTGSGVGVWERLEDEIDWSSSADSSPHSEGEEAAPKLTDAWCSEPFERARPFLGLSESSDQEKVQSMLAEVSSCIANDGSLLEVNRLLERSHASLSWKKINAACRTLGWNLCTREILGLPDLREALSSRPWTRIPMSLMRNQELRAVKRAFCVRVARPAVYWY